MKLSKNFWITEFVPKAIFGKYGESSKWFIDPLITMIAQGIRDFFGKPTTVNNWYDKGGYNLSGFRPPTTALGAGLSQHKFGRAADIKVDGVTSEELQNYIKDNHDLGNKALPFWLHQIKCLEIGTKGWTHVDVRDTGSDKLMIIDVTPKK